MAFYPTSTGGSQYAKLAAMGGIGAGANGGGSGVQIGAPRYSGSLFANNPGDGGPSTDPNSIWYGNSAGYRSYIGGEQDKALGMQTYERTGGTGNGGAGSAIAQPWNDPTSPWYGNMSGYQANAQRSPWLDSTSPWYGNEAGFRANQAASGGAAIAGYGASSAASGVSSAQSQSSLDQLAHPGMVLYHGGWVYPYSISPTMSPNQVSGIGGGPGLGR